MKMNKIILILGLLISINLYAKPVKFKKQEYKKERINFWCQLKYMRNSIVEKKFKSIDIIGSSMFINNSVSQYKNKELEVLLISKNNLMILKKLMIIKDSFLQNEISDKNKNAELAEKFQLQIAKLATFISLYLKENSKIERYYCSDEIMAEKYKKNPAELAEELAEKAAEFAKKGEVEKAIENYNKAIEILLAEKYIAEDILSKIYLEYADMFFKLKDYKKAISIFDKALKIMNEKKVEEYYKIAIYLKFAEVANIQKNYIDVEKKYRLAETLIVKYLGDDSKEATDLYWKYLEFYKKMNNKEKVYFYKNILKDFYPEKFPEFFEQAEKSEESFLE